MKYENYCNKFTLGNYKDKKLCFKALDNVKHSSAYVFQQVLFAIEIFSHIRFFIMRAPPDASFSFFGPLFKMRMTCLTVTQDIE